MTPADSPKHTCILTIQADRPGGVPTLVDWWYHFLTKWGQQATVLYAAFESEPVSRWERLKGVLRAWRVHPRPEHPNPTLANAALPFPLFLFYFVPQWIAGPVLRRFSRVVVASGSSHVALPLALRWQPFVLWVATLYEDELNGKAQAGDTWAASVLSNPFWPFLRWQERFVLRRATRILALSPYTQRRILDFASEVADRVEVALVPIDAAHFAPPDQQPRGRTLLAVGRINDPRKNTKLLLEAFALVHEQHPDLTLILAGDTPGAGLLEQRDRLGLGDAVDFRGQVSADELLDLYRGAQLFLIGSTQEGLGIVMLEAMAAGTPVVATDCGGPEGIVVDGETGALVPNNDPQAMAEAVLNLLDDPGQLQALRGNCVAFIKEHCDIPVVEATLRRHFEEAFAGDSDPAADRRSAIWRWLAAGWAVFVFVMYMQHQMALLWPSIRAQLIEPLLRAGQ
jgi:glycosyltransferase involved in cell wall biosynthesis